MVTARTAILQALRQGPGYGRLLMRLVSTATGGRASLAPGSVYPTLKALEKARLVRKWTVIAG
jgi:DNA-binding PadR family transcriptional regulator